jgi:hypothetical protein
MTPTKFQAVNITYRQPVQPRVPAQHGILEERWLHKVFLITHIPATWGPERLALLLLAGGFFTWIVWLPVGWAAVAAGIYLVFAMSDWLLLVWLPRLGRSFGPVGPQLLVQTAPRLAVAALSAILAWLFDPTNGGLLLLTVLQLLGSGLYLWGMLVEPFALGLTGQTVQPAAWRDRPVCPLRLLHLSDLHVERLTRREAKLLDLIEQAQPDLIVFTGDFLNLSYVDDPTARAEVRQVLAQLRAPYGVFATLGSPPVDPRHETPSLLDGFAIRLLRDEVAVINLPDGRKLSLIGLDCEHDLISDESALRQLLAVTPADSARVLLYHSPELMPVARSLPLDLYLCGHTHGGQIRLPGYGAILTSSVTGKRYEAGRYDEQGTILYVSRGIGLEGLSAPRMRLLCPPEIVLWEVGR